MELDKSFEWAREEQRLSGQPTGGWSGEEGLGRECRVYNAFRVLGKLLKRRKMRGSNESILWPFATPSQAPVPWTWNV